MHQTREGRLRVIAANLRRAYSAEPLSVPEAFKDQIYALKDQPAPRGEGRAPSVNSRVPPPCVKQLCEGVDPQSTVEHIIVCPVCGQMFDCRDKASVDHHSSMDHSPKLS